LALAEIQDQALSRMVGAGESEIARWMLAGALGFIAAWALVRSGTGPV
jgi:hypothetical protein